MRDINAKKTALDPVQMVINVELGSLGSRIINAMFNVPSVEFLQS